MLPEMKRLKRTFAVLFLGFALATGTVLAHPHVFIDSRVTFQFNEHEMEGFWVEWHFDPLFTSMIVMDFGASWEGSLSPNVVRAIREGAFSNLRNYDYFLYVLETDGVHPVREVERFDAFMRDRRVVYRFFVPFRRPLDARTRTLRIRMYDDTFFTDIAFEEDSPISVESPVALEQEFLIQQNRNVKIQYDNRDQAVRRDDAVYTGLTHPWEAHFQYRHGER